MKVLQFGCVLLMAMVGIRCNSEADIHSTNLTDLHVPDYVGQRVWERTPDEATSLSIVYMKTLRLPRAGKSVSVCYEATTDDTIYYGLVTRVEEKWFATCQVSIE